MSDVKTVSIVKHGASVFVQLIPHKGLAHCNAQQA